MIRYKRIAKRLVKKQKLQQKLSSLQWDWVHEQYTFENPYEREEWRRNAHIRMERIQKKIDKVRNRLTKY